MSVSKKDLQLLLAAVGILAVVAVFFLVFKPYKEKTDALKIENENLAMQVAQLEELEENKETYITETAVLEQKIKEVYMQFPSNVQEEDAISEGIEIEKASQIVNGAIEYSAAESTYTPIAETIDQMPAPESPISSLSDTEEATEEGEVTEEEVVSSLALMKQPVKYDFVCNLATFMRAADYISKQDNRDVITGLRLVYDESTGYLAGEINVNKYYISGLNKDYDAASFGSVPTGSLNLFSTLSLPEGAIVVPTDESSQNESEE